MADAPMRAQALLGIDNGVHEFVGMECTFHQSLDLARPCERNSLSRSGYTVFRRNHLVGGQIEPSGVSSSADLVFRPYKYRRD
jgi:hypothetical protein